jgi:hypothetical protein
LIDRLRAFIRRRTPAPDEDQRWKLIESAFGSIEDRGHASDDDPAAWVRAQRSGEPNRVDSKPADE